MLQIKHLVYFLLLSELCLMHMECRSCERAQGCVLHWVQLWGAKKADSQGVFYPWAPSFIRFCCCLPPTSSPQGHSIPLPQTFTLQPSEQFGQMYLAFLKQTIISALQDEGELSPGGTGWKKQSWPEDCVAANPPGDHIGVLVQGGLADPSLFPGPRAWRSPARPSGGRSGDRSCSPR